MNKITININGQAQQLAPQTSVTDLLTTLGHAEQGMALAVNQSIISRSEWPDHYLQQGDEVSLFQAIAGG
ncbi:sulfur carrier protein ThiS [Motilimonas cestriensis]|uniref:Sulfur carrier protein ThiS n=1 Tax=Motilimonas cestriensis TaxID=2742685 RepID=A0ABS8W6G8_9GAMM|nr:sulfur carrier protein ThiS [Motilimonas cestriensis]MCE2594100.1 sulfur carrier protein ThiS [Motilimonas cestriensis]